MELFNLFKNLTRVNSSVFKQNYKANQIGETNHVGLGLLVQNSASGADRMTAEHWVGADIAVTKHFELDDPVADEKWK